MRTSVEDCLAEFAGHIGRMSLPDGVVENAKLCILDWLGCVVGAGETEPVRALATALEDELGRGTAVAFAGPALANPRTAALLNGTAAHTLELDDIYSPALYHPAAPVISAALAAAQAAGADGGTFLRAVVAGYEISNRIGTIVNPAHYKYWHSTGTIGTFGAAVAASIALRLTASETAWALGHAASMAAGLQQAFRSDAMTKPLHAGRAAEGGLLAARAAQCGVTGPKSMLAGPVGFGQAMSGNPDWGQLPEEFDGDFTIAATTFKRFSACGHTFAAVDGILELSAREHLSSNQIASVHVGTYRVATEVAGISRPTTAFESKFSLQFCVAAALAGYDMAADQTYVDALRDPAVRDITERVTVAVDLEIDRFFPRLRGARVSIVLHNGQVCETLVQTRKGAPENPLTTDEMREKFDKLINRVSFPVSANRLAKWVNGLDRGSDISARFFLAGSDHGLRQIALGGA